jgi:hypothetical protein
LYYCCSTEARGESSFRPATGGNAYIPEGVIFLNFFASEGRADGSRFAAFRSSLWSPSHAQGDVKQVGGHAFAAAEAALAARVARLATKTSPNE